jgi:hypothetical protein
MQCPWDNTLLETKGPILSPGMVRRNRFQSRRGNRDWLLLPAGLEVRRSAGHRTGFEHVCAGFGSSSQMEMVQMVPAVRRVGSLLPWRGSKSYSHMERSRLWVFWVFFSRRTTLFPHLIGNSFWHNEVGKDVVMWLCYRNKTQGAPLVWCRTPIFAGRLPSLQGVSEKRTHW